MSALIPPSIPRGTRDFLPEEMAKRRFVMDKIIGVFKRFGYDEIETPVIEHAETILGSYGEEGNKLTYTFKDKGDRLLALRYDQTVPFARVVAMNYKELPMPFKRYQISRVWRGDRPAKGRYREFYQCDIDIIGTDSLVADTEIAKVIYVVLQELGFANFIIQFNSRKFLNSLLKKFNISAEQQTAVIRSIDKLAKIGRAGVAEELTTVMEKKSIAELLDVITVQGSLAEKLEVLKQYDVQEVREFYDLCRATQIPESQLLFTPELARGLDYYTGIVYEVIIPEGDIGSVAGGGRYDNLCSRFIKERFSGVGVAFGFERIMDVMEKQGMLEDIGLNTKVLVTYFDRATLDYSLSILDELQKENIPAELYFEPEKLSKQIKYADRKQIPFVIVCGPDEMKSETVTIKMMRAGKQKTIAKKGLLEAIRSPLR